MKDNKTQGNRKILEREKEILENENFQNDLKGLLSIKDKFQKNKKLHEIAEKYSIDDSIGSPLFKLSQSPLSDFTRIDNDVDVCQIYDQKGKEYDLVSMAVYSDDPDSFPEKIKKSKYKFPIHIAVSPLASKRDVLDFINKRWFEIRGRLDKYQENDITNFRKKPNEERDRFIWEHRDLPASEIADLVNEKFPNSNLIYSDISSILYILRKRKTSKKV